MPAPIPANLLRGCAVLADLPPAELAALAATMRPRRYKRGETVLHLGDPGDTMHVVLEGRLKVTVPLEDGDDSVLRVLGPGAIFGELALLDGQPRSATVVALEPVQTAVLHRDALRELLRTSPDAAGAMLAAVARLARRLTGELADLLAVDLAGRLARRLVELAAAHGVSEPGGGVLIDVRLTQDELAGMIGGTRASVNKLIGQFEDDKLLARRGRQLVLLKPDALKRRAG